MYALHALHALLSYDVIALALWM